MLDMRQVIKDNPILAIMRNVPMEKTVPYVEAIMKGGVKFFEVALNSKEGVEQIRLLKETFGDQILLGAGTAINVERAMAAVNAGAQFLLAPSTDIAVLEYCREYDVAIMPGALTPTDVSNCVAYGFNTIKLFPAGDMPMSYVKSLKGPFDDTEYVAIGGVNADNAADFIKAGYLGIGLGSNMMPKSAVAKGDWATGTQYVAELVKNVEAALAER